MMDLVRYDAACKAIAEAKTFDEAKDIRDLSVAMAVYARKAKNRDLEADAIEIRMRATRRVDELRQQLPLSRGTRGSRVKGARGDDYPTLASQGIDKNLAKEARSLGRLDAAQFEAVIVEARQKVGRVVRNVVSIRDKAGERAAREQVLGQLQRAMPTCRYGVILADPPWRFEPRSRETGMDRAPDNHYPTMTVDKIMEIDPPAASDSTLWLWVPVPFEAIGHEVMTTWDFGYVSQFVWVKDKIGTGYWNRNRHELLLIGTRGDIPAPSLGMQFDSVIEAPTREHSRKPDRAYEIIESYFPTMPKLEMFARHARPGWDAWGLEAPPQPRAVLNR